MVIWLIAAAALALWVLLLLALVVATRNQPVRPSPPAGELTEPPAVVALLTGGWRLGDGAASATLLDLAARGAVRIEEIGPDLSLVGLGRTMPVTPCEELVLDRVRALAVDGVVPADALAEGTRDLRRWRKRFADEVQQDARARGLSRPRWSRAHKRLLRLAALVPAVALAVAVYANGPGGGPVDMSAIGSAAYLITFLLLLLGRLKGERGTPLGVQVAAQWLGVGEHLAGGRFAEQPPAAVTVWGRHLAYAAALGLAPRAVTGLPVGRPADDSRAWSDYGGMWHPVTVRYPSRLLWGHRPPVMIRRALGAGLFTVLATCAAALALSSVDLWSIDQGFPVAVTAGFVVTAVPICLALADLVSPITLSGQIVRLRRRRIGGIGESNDMFAFWCAVDEGRQREVTAFGIAEEVWDDLREGHLVRMRAGRILGWITSVEVLGRSPHRGGR